MKIQRLYGTRRNLCRVLMFTAAVLTLAIQASADPAGGGLPWAAPMTAIATSLTSRICSAGWAARADREVVAQQLAAAVVADGSSNMRALTGCYWPRAI